MGKEYGKDWRVEIGDGATPTEAFTEIGGEVSFDWSRSSKEIDLSTKDDGQYAATGFGQQSVTISVNGKVSLPDDGLERAASVAKASTPVCNVKIMKGAIVKYAGSMAVGNFSTTHPNDEVCTWKFDLKSAAAPTTDDLGATT